ncbi:MAG: N-6 DNA methylase [Acidobacteria bacterium]|nr:N-6 DNA methylase [Acidobacteriota bacterium]
MPAGFSGNLISGQYAEGLIDQAPRVASLRTALSRWWRHHVESFGPASSPRALYGSATALLSLLEYRELPGLVLRNGAACGEMAPAVALMANPWHESPDTRWRDAVRHAIEAGREWCFCFNGRVLRLIDARRTYARRYVEFDLPVALGDERIVALLAAVFHASAVDVGDHPSSRTPSRLDEIIGRSAQETLAVCRNLKEGVLEALGSLVEGLALASGRRSRRPDLQATHEQALTLVYRLLFLFFAEAQRLVPTWHPIYRDSYSLDGLCSLMQAGTEPPAVWETLQAIWRLAHAGCEADDLKVTAFNGRLFSPRETPLGDGPRVDDRHARRAILALATAPGPGRQEGRRRVAYRDLGVEELGAVYENVLDYVPQVSHAGGSPTVVLRPGGVRRKATGTFYTPRSLTDFLVRRTLHPLVADAHPDAILRLRVLDPTMGSGAFLVGACRYLATAYEEALLRIGACGSTEIDNRDRVSFRRLIAQRCLFGVDLNPMAVQLARLSLWLTTLAADRPLSFLDHRLICGDSLVGAAPDDILRQPPGTATYARATQLAALPLFETSALRTAVQHVVPIRARLANEPDDTVAAVREKDRTLAGLTRAESVWTRWLRLADLWCACWFWDDRSRPDRATYHELAEHITTGSGSLPRSVTRRLLDQAEAIAAGGQFCHWPLQFPEAFFEPDGSPRGDAGFDAVLGNPPWEMLRADTDADQVSRARTHAQLTRMMRFIRSSGIYQAHQQGHPNQYQLFVERAAQLTRSGGRIGLVLPWGLAADVGSASLRRLLLQRCHTDTLIGFDNTEGIFPIHRGVRFLLVTTTKDTAARPRVQCRFGERDPSALDDLGDARGDDSQTRSLMLDAGLLERLSGPDLSIPYLRTREDLALVERLHAEHPPLEDPRGWAAEFGRELNATEDRGEFARHPGSSPDILPVLDGKHIAPFCADLQHADRAITTSAASRLVDATRTFRRPRLAYRDVASPTNRLTLIAAIVPSGCLTTHTLFCLRTPLRRDEQEALCALLNSYVANYLVRLRVSSHVTVGIMRRLPVPRPDADSETFRELGRLSRRLAARPLGDALFDSAEYIRLQCLAAKLYQLKPTEFEYVLSTFPLVPEAAKRTTLRIFGAEP